MFATDHIHELFNDRVRIGHIGYGYVARVLGFARCVYHIEALAWREDGLYFVQATLYAPEYGRSLAGRVYAMKFVVN